MPVPREGTRKRTVYEIFKNEGSEAAMKVGSDLGLKANSVKTWMRGWSKTPPADEQTRSRQVTRAKLRVGPAGRVVIPAAMRSAMGIGEGEVLMAELAEGELRLLTVQEAVRRAQELVRQYVPEGVSLVDEFLAERRRMWGEE